VFSEFSTRGVAGRRCAARAGAALVTAVVAVTVGLLASASSALASPSCSGTTTVTCTFAFSGALDSFTVPAGVSQVTITADGAQGGLSLNGGTPGKGAQVKGDFVTPSHTLSVVVGQAGSTPGTGGGGGGGGSFVWTGSAFTDATASSLLLAAAGGGGSNLGAGSDGSATTTPNDSAGGGTGGSGGNGGGVIGTVDGGGGGGGLLSDGANATLGAFGGQALDAGAAGGANCGGGGGSNGGFGGGGGGCAAGGGGGGYNGGGGSSGNVVGGGGGGGSFLASGATNTSRTSGANSGDGSVRISYTNPASALAAQLVTDSAGKGPGKALAGKAAAIQAAVNAGQTATACADIADYLGLVKAQTGKKLSRADATTLTNDANDLAAALGC
jgi:hypothetical protein